MEEVFCKSKNNDSSSEDNFNSMDNNFKITLTTQQSTETFNSTDSKNSTNNMIRVTAQEDEFLPNYYNANLALINRIETNFFKRTNTKKRNTITTFKPSLLSLKISSSGPNSKRDSIKRSVPIILRDPKLNKPIVEVIDFEIQNSLIFKIVQYKIKVIDSFKKCYYIERKFQEILYFRKQMLLKFPGFFIPALPSKEEYNDDYLTLLMKIINNFFKKLPEFIYESIEFQNFISQMNFNVEMSIKDLDYLLNDIYFLRTCCQSIKKVAKNRKEVSNEFNIINYKKIKNFKLLIDENQKELLLIQNAVNSLMYTIKNSPNYLLDLNLIESFQKFEEEFINILTPEAILLPNDATFNIFNELINNEPCFSEFTLNSLAILKEQIFVELVEIDSINESLINLVSFIDKLNFYDLSLSSLHSLYKNDENYQKTNDFKKVLMEIVTISINNMTFCEIPEFKRERQKKFKEIIKEFEKIRFDSNFSECDLRNIEEVFERYNKSFEL